MVHTHFVLRITDRTTFPFIETEDIVKALNIAGLFFIKKFWVHTAVMKNILLGNSRIFAKIFRRHTGKKLCHSAFHPHVNGKRLDAVQTEQQSAVGNLYADARYLHQIPPCLFIIAGSAFFKVNFARIYLLGGIDKITTAKSRTQRRKVVGGEL